MLAVGSANPTAFLKTPYNYEYLCINPTYLGYLDGLIPQDFPAGSATGVLAIVIVQCHVPPS